MAIESAVTYDQAEPEKLASGPGEILITTALKREGLLNSLDIIGCLLKARGQRQALVIACENQVDSVYLREQLEERGYTPGGGTVFARAVVDRICNKPRLVRGRVEVACEDFARIDVESRSDLRSPLLRTLIRGSSSAIHAAKDFARVVERKKWVVNAPHLLLALVAHYYRFPTVKAFVSEDFGRRVLDGAFKELGELVTNYYDRSRIHPPELTAFAKAVKERIKKFPQRYPDVVTRLSGPDRIIDFFDDYERKIVALPLEEMEATDNHARYFSALVTFIVVELIKERRWITNGA